jgi:thiol-disulfide isomerase/thioredoxin
MKSGSKKILIIVVIIVIALAAIGVAFMGQQPTNNTNGVQIQTFQTFEGEVCTQDGKPVIRLFSTTWCSHCQWIGETYENVVKEYVDRGEIVAHHWELDANDDTLTPEFEAQVPESELAIYRQFNPRGSIPTFVFGCKYYRIGNGYEQQGNLGLEEAEFRLVIEELIS